MATTSFSGLATGIDSSALISSLVQFERQPITRLEEKQTDLTSQGRRLTEIRSRLKALQTASKNLDSRTEILASSGKSSDESILKASATGGASLGTYEIEVEALAKAGRNYTNGFASKTQTGLFGTGTFSVTVGDDDPVAISVTGTDTLESLVTKINASDARVTAGILFDGTNYRLQISGNETGANNALSFDDGTTLLNLEDTDNQLVEASDAVFWIDGFKMTRPTNSATDAIPGVTLELKKETATGENVNVEVGRDPDALATKVQEFITAYNGVMTGLNAESAFLGSARVGDSLSGDSALRGLQAHLRGIIGREVEDLAGNYTTLRSIGVETRNDGTLSLNKEDLKEAIAADPEAIASLFMKDNEAGTVGVMSQLDELIQEYVKGGDGVLTTKLSGIESRKRSIGSQIERMELSVDKFEERMRVQFASLEQLVSNIQSQGSQMLTILGSL